jgi:hypothetical protein
LNLDEAGSNERYLPSTERQTIQSQQSVSKLNENTDSIVAKQILCKNPSLYRSFGSRAEICPNRRWAITLQDDQSQLKINEGIYDWRCILAFPRATLDLQRVCIFISEFPFDSEISREVSESARSCSWR